MSTDCVFCKIVKGDGPATIIRFWDDAIAIVPLNPVVEGHVVVLPKTHVTDAAEDEDVTGATMRRTAELARERYDQFNIITSAGPAATQTVFHLHVHIVPRYTDDGLALPWTGQQK